MKMEEEKTSPGNTLVRKGIGLTLAAALVTMPLSPLAFADRALAAQSSESAAPASAGTQATPAPTETKLAKVVLEIRKQAITDGPTIERMLAEADMTSQRFLDTPTAELAQGDSSLAQAVDWVKDQLRAVQVQPEPDPAPEPAPEPVPVPTDPDSSSASDNPKEDGEQSTSGSAASTAKDAGASSNAGTKKSPASAAKPAQAEPRKAETPERDKYPAWSYRGDNSYTAHRSAEVLSTAKFIAMIGEPARSVAADYDLYASVLIAHAILQSDSGNSPLAQDPYNNLFAFKGTIGASNGATGIDAQTPHSSATRKSYESEDTLAQRRAAAGSSGGWYNPLALEKDRGNDAEGEAASTRRFTVRDGYRAYDGIADSLQDYSESLAQGLFGLRKPITKQNLPTFEAACYRMEKDLDIQGYGDSLRELIEEYDLTRFDEPLDYEWEKDYEVAVSREEVSGPAADGQASGEGDTVMERRTVADLVVEATSHLGDAYVWGGTTPGSFDCSGFVGYSFKQALGVALPRTTHYQCLLGTDVDFDELRTGDLMFFVDEEGVVDHVAMYLDEGCYIEASGSARQVTITAIEEKKPDFAKRIL